MGNDQSNLKGLEVDKKAIEVTDFWSLYNAEIPKEDGSTLLSIFQGEPLVNGQLWVNQSPLERATKNFMIYRYPCILKYVASWDRGSQKLLATERCRPLSLVIQTQTDVQICLGLRNILCSLIFLTEQAKARHLNICPSSIYVSVDGTWRLAGFEHVWAAKELTKDLLTNTKSYRYSKAVDANEVKNIGDGLEQYAFAVLCDEILKNNKTENTEFVSEFREYCSTQMKHATVAMRPKLSEVLLHPYFNHEFVLIHSFLTELPLKNLIEKQNFFTGLIDKLRYFDETIVASQLGKLLLSRMVLLDTTAQLCVTPYILKTKTDISAALFTNPTYTKYIIPIIKQIFYVRDTQIRMILLEYFKNYIHLLTKEELQEQILPNLLLGIKDLNETLVEKTLRCLADLVPILGSAAVIGGNRGRLFADGRPQGLPDSTIHWVEPRSITPVISSGGYVLSGSPIPDNVDVSESFVSVNGNGDDNLLPANLSSDGGEDIRTATDGELEDDDGAWSEWENNDINSPSVDVSNTVDETIDRLDTLTVNDKSHTIIIEPAIKTKTELNPLTTNTAKPASVRYIEDINELDIKNKKFTPLHEVEEIDFFKDMEPKIETTKIIILPDNNNQLIQNNSLNYNNNNNNIQINDTKQKIRTIDETVTVDDSRFQIKIENDDLCESGWDDDTNDWGNDN